MKTKLLTSMVFALAACTKDAPAPTPSATPHFPKAPAMNAPAMPAPAGDAAGALTGTIAEKIDVPSYSYLRITTASGDVWAAVPTTAKAVGAPVTVAHPMEMHDFESKALKRTFAVISFGELGDEAAPPAAPPAAGNPHEGLGMAAAPAAANLKTPKADGAGAQLVSEVFANKTKLKNTNVAVRGKVVKFTGGVMGKNWVHLRDGSGSEATHDNDLIVTTKDETGVGDEVTVRGVVHLDIDLGSGYAYPVLLEDASLTKH